MPMEQGFLRCLKFYRDEEFRRGRDLLRRIFSHTTMPAQPNFAAQKIFRAECVFGRVEEPSAAQNARISAK
jgi:hypothetical protein